VGSKAGS